MFMDDIISADDEEILRFIESSRPKIFVVGTGGSGSNTVNRLTNIGGIKGATLICMNTDAAHLVKTRSERKILLGKKATKGLGAGSDIKLGEEAAVESKEEIRHVLGGAGMVFITCGLGGGTGTGSIATIAHEARELGAITIAIVTLPFSSEGRTRMSNAIEGLDRLKKMADTVIIIHNDKLLSVAADLPLNMAFRVSDEVLASATKGIVEMVTVPGMVNIDFADLKSVLKDSGYAVIGSGEGISVPNSESSRGMIALKNAIDSPMLDADISKSRKALVDIVGGDSLTLREAESIFQEVAGRISPDAMVKWGARIDKEMKKDSVRVLLVVSGVDFPEYEQKNVKEMLKENEGLDIGKV